MWKIIDTISAVIIAAVIVIYDFCQRVTKRKDQKVNISIRANLQYIAALVALVIFVGVVSPVLSGLESITED